MTGQDKRVSQGHRAISTPGTSSPSDLALRPSHAVPWSYSHRTLVQSPALTWQRQ